MTFDDPQTNQRGQLEQSKHVDPCHRHVLKKNVFRLVFSRDEEQQDSVVKLEALQRGYTHEKENSK